MLIRKFAIASFVLAALGLTVTLATGVIGQQPGTTEKSPGVAEKKAPAAVPTSGATGLLGGADDLAPSASNAIPPAVAGESGAGTSSTSDEEAEAKAPPAGWGPAAESTSGAPMARGKAVTQKTKKSGTSAGGAMMPGGMPGMGGMPAGGGAPGMMSGMPGMAGGMMGSGSMPAVSEDEHLETWVNRALADYVQTEDQNARKEQREQIANALDRIFDIRQERRMEELESLEQRVQKLRATLETREKLKSEILKNRLDYLIREADGLGWGDGPPAAGRSLMEALMGAPAGKGTGAGPMQPKRPAKGSSGKKTSNTSSGASTPRKGLEFLAAYPKFFGLSLEMTEQQFRDFAISKALEPLIRSDANRTQYLIPTGDGQTIIVMFGKNGDKCGGIQRVRGEAGDDGTVDEAPRPEGSERERSTRESDTGSGSSSAEPAADPAKE